MNKNYSIKELNNLLIKKKIKPSDIIKNTFYKLEKNYHLNSTVTILKKESILLSKELDKINIDFQKNNFLFSIPYFAKDNFATKNILTTACSKILSNFIPNFNATVIDLLSKKNSILIGKSVLDELGMGGDGLSSCNGHVLNPLDNSRITGGSSSGSASLVSAGIVPFSLGSDTGDSIRKPASYNGIVGFKPTYGLISRFGLIPYAPSLDTVGYFTTNVEDAAIILDILAKKDNKDFTSFISNEKFYYKNLNKNVNFVKKLKFVYIKEVNDFLPLKIKSEFENLFFKLRKMNFFVKEINFPKILLKSLLSIYMIISYAEAVSSHSNLNSINFGIRYSSSNKNKIKNYNDIIINSRSNSFGNVVKKRFIIGSYVLNNKNQNNIFLKAKKIRRLIVNILSKILDDYDILLLPSSSDIAPKIKDIKKQKIKIKDINNYNDNILILANLMGNPSITIPFIKKENLPIGINLNSKLFSEQKLLNASFFLENLINF